ncbi:hypothetical protein JCM33374_g6451 [Metschnikowia sp. JCM 33374]|nr:hypothetical protein JCM33374_g6451 [Metschnikowia sp. JCM 33374]
MKTPALIQIYSGVLSVAHCAYLLAPSSTSPSIHVPEIDTFTKRGLFSDLFNLCISGDLSEGSEFRQGNPRCTESTRDLITTASENQPVNSHQKAAAKSMRAKLDIIRNDMLLLEKDITGWERFEKLSRGQKVEKLIKAINIWNLCMMKYRLFSNDEWDNLAAHTTEKKLVKLEGFQNDIVELFTHTKAFILTYLRNFKVDGLM